MVAPNADAPSIPPTPMRDIKKGRIKSPLSPLVSTGRMSVTCDKQDQCYHWITAAVFAQIKNQCVGVCQKLIAAATVGAQTPGSMNASNFTYAMLPNRISAF